MATAAHQPLEPDRDATRTYLAEYFGRDIHLVSILPDGTKDDVSGRYFGEDADRAEAWAFQENQKGWNVYTTVNIVKAGLNKKPKGTLDKTDPANMGEMAAHRFIHLDWDPPKTKGSVWSIDDCRERLAALKYPPSFILYTGGGVAAFWRLDETVADRVTIERVNRALAQMFGGDHCHNHDRLMRLAGTVNIPDLAKRARGRKEALAYILEADDGVVYPLHALAAEYKLSDDRDHAGDRVAIAVGDFQLLTSADLGLGPFDPLKSLIDHPRAVDRSTDVIACAGRMVRDGYNDAQIMGVLMNPANAVYAHLASQRDPRYQALRCLEKARSDQAKAQQDAGAGINGTASHAGLPIERFSDIKPQLTGLWLVKRLLPAEGLALIYGHPGCGKSFLALDMAFHIALGWDWQGRRVKSGFVVYIGAEGLAGLRNRVTAFRQDNSVEEAAFTLIPTPIDMQAPDADVRRLAQVIRDETEHFGMPPALIVIDTLSKTFGAGKENTDDMAIYIANCGRIAAEFKCCVMPVHHRPKDAESEEPRGHSSLKGGVDTVILVEAGITKKARVTKQKDGEIGEVILFNLKPIELGEDEDGEPVTSCVVSPAFVDETPRGDPIALAIAKLPDSGKLALRHLMETTEHVGFAPPTDIPNAEINRMRVGKVVRLTDWRDKAIMAAGTERDSDRDNRDTAKRTFNRSLQRLQKDGIVRVWGEYAWRDWGASISAGTGRDSEAGQQRDTGQAGTKVLETCPVVPVGGHSRFSVEFPPESAAPSEARAGDRRIRTVF